MLNFRSKLAAAVVATAITAATALATGTASPAAAWGWKHFHRGPFVADCYGNKPHHICFGHVRGYRYGFTPFYGHAGACGWRVRTYRAWNAAHTKLLVLRKNIWVCT